MIEDLGEQQNTGIRVIMVVANGRTRYVTSRHRNNPDRVFAGIEAHHELEKEQENGKEDNTSQFMVVWGLGGVEVYGPKRAKRCDNCTHRGVWGCPSRDGSPCKSWSGVQLSPTMRKLSAMLREELR